MQKALTPSGEPRIGVRGRRRNDNFLLLSRVLREAHFNANYKVQNVDFKIKCAFP